MQFGFFNIFRYNGIPIYIREKFSIFHWKNSGFGDYYCLSLFTLPYLHLSHTFVLGKNLVRERYNSYSGPPNFMFQRSFLRSVTHHTTHTTGTELQPVDVVQTPARRPLLHIDSTQTTGILVPRLAGWLAVCMCVRVLFRHTHWAPPHTPHTTHPLPQKGSSLVIFLTPWLFLDLGKSSKSKRRAPPYPT